MNRGKLGRDSALRTLQRLKSGVPPGRDISQLTVGWTAERRHLCDWIEQAASGGHLWRAICGDPGDGKSHFLQLARQMALERGLAVAHLASDADLGALNHPQRNLYLLSSTLESQNFAAAGFSQILRQTVTGEESRVQDLIAELSRSDDRLGSRFASLLQRSLASTDQRTELLKLAGCGDLVGRPVSDWNRRQAYNRLQLIVRVLGCLNCKGLLVLIEDADSIFTKLPTVRSRLGAYRCLSFYCSSAQLRQVVVLIAMTHQGFEKLLNDVPGPRESPPLFDRLEEEAVGSFRRELRNEARYDLPPITAGDWEVLSRVLHELYARAYPEWSRIPVEASWSRLVEACIAAAATPRLFIKAILSVLDSMRLNGQAPRRSI